MPLKKHELTQKQKMDDYSVERNILIMTSAKQFLLMKLYLELEKLSKENGEKIGEKHGISYNKHEKK